MRSIDSFLNQDKDVVTSVNTVDIRSIYRKEDPREKTICCVIKDDGETKKKAEADDDFEIDQPELKIRSSQAALSTADDRNSFCEILGDVNLVSVLHLVT